MLPQGVVSGPKAPRPSTGLAQARVTSDPSSCCRAWWRSRLLDYVAALLTAALYKSVGLTTASGCARKRSTQIGARGCDHGVVREARAFLAAVPPHPAAPAEADDGEYDGAATPWSRVWCWLAYSWMSSRPRAAILAGCETGARERSHDRLDREKTGRATWFHPQVNMGIVRVKSKAAEQSNSLVSCPILNSLLTPRPRRDVAQRRLLASLAGTPGAASLPATHLLTGADTIDLVKSRLDRPDAGRPRRRLERRHG